MISVPELVDDALGLLLGDGALTKDEFGEAAIKLVGALATSIEQLAAAVEPLKAGLPVAPATPAGTTALGDLPELRDFKVWVQDLQCAEAGCGSTTIVYKRAGTLREILATIAAHRREYHVVVGS